MSSRSNNNGRAFEYACLKALENLIGEHQQVRVNTNEGYEAANVAWDTLSPEEKEVYELSATAGIKNILELEPIVFEDDDSEVELKIQIDTNGIAGDVRDVLIIRNEINWEIGISAKHNHDAVKHSRLSHVLDFGESWFSSPCTQDYWNDISPIFDDLKIRKSRNEMWRDLECKDDEVYVPILNAFIDEIKRKSEIDNEIVKEMVRYMIGRVDFYKLISMDKKRIAKVETVNIHGTLNNRSISDRTSIEIPIVELPTRLVEIDFKPNSKNTVEMYLDNGWQFSFRLHNASSKVEPSLKFDIKMVGRPVSILVFENIW